jgi:hypothetical protein
MPDETDRPATVGSDHKRRGIPSSETLGILARYRAALRAELAETLTELRADTRPDLDTRAQLVGLAVKIARELAVGSDVLPGPASATSSATRGKPPRLTARDRAALER